MTIQLLPVIEIGYNNQDIPAPDTTPHRDSEAWDGFYQKCYAKAGFTDKVTPYLSGFPLYRLVDITTDNLIKLVKDHTEDWRNRQYEREQVCTFFGGYILRVDGEDKFFPQCCGELKDIEYWKHLADGQRAYYEGHPAPQIGIQGSSVMMDFSVDEYDESFMPPPPERLLVIDRNALKNAVEEVREELDNFGRRLEEINRKENLGIADIDRLLIWG